MPHWCENYLRVTGEKEELQKFKEFAVEKEEVLSANKFIPYPEEFNVLDKKIILQGEKRNKLIEDLKKKGTPEAKAREESYAKYPSIKDGYNSGGYDWCIKNWGTKWGFCRSELVKEYEDELLYRFETAWSPPLPLIKAMGEMFTELEFDLRYFECGMGFNGMYTVKNGEVLFDKSGNYFGERGG